MSSIPTSSTGNLCLCTCTFNYRIVENFRGRNSHKFRSFMAILESFLCEIWGVVSFGMAKTSNSWKFSPQKLYFSPIREFSSRKVSRYTVCEGWGLSSPSTCNSSQAPWFNPRWQRTPSVFTSTIKWVSIYMYDWHTKCFTKCSGTDDLVPYEGCKGLLKVLCSLWSLPCVSLIVITTLIFWLFIKINNYNWYLIFKSYSLYGKHSP